jgi:hypothetical protein
MAEDIRKAIDLGDAALATIRPDTELALDIAADAIRYYTNKELDKHYRAGGTKPTEGELDDARRFIDKFDELGRMSEEELDEYFNTLNTKQRRTAVNALSKFIKLQDKMQEQKAPKVRVNKTHIKKAQLQPRNKNWIKEVRIRDKILIPPPNGSKRHG